jgi:hypothetical protein
MLDIAKGKYDIFMESATKLKTVPITSQLRVGKLTNEPKWYYIEKGKFEK